MVNAKITDLSKNPRMKLTYKRGVDPIDPIPVIVADTIYDTSKYNCFVEPFKITQDCIKTMMQSEESTNNRIERLIPVYFIVESKETLVGYTTYDFELSKECNYSQVFIKFPTFIDTDMANLAKFSLMYRSFDMLCPVGGIAERFVKNPDLQNMIVPFVLIVANEDLYTSEYVGMNGIKLKDAPDGNNEGINDDYDEGDEDREIDEDDGDNAIRLEEPSDLEEEDSDNNTAEPSVAEESSDEN